MKDKLSHSALIPVLPSVSRLRLRGMGLGDGGGGRGDLYAIIRYALPEALTLRQRELIAEVGRAGTGQVSGGAREGGDA